MGSGRSEKQTKETTPETPPPPPPTKPPPPPCNNTTAPLLPTRSMTELLPDGILTDILSRLPAQSVCVCRCVCKTFLTLTTPHQNPSFPKLHLSRTKSHHQFLIRAYSFGIPRPFQTLHLLEPESVLTLPSFPKLHFSRRFDGFRLPTTTNPVTVRVKPKFLIPKTRKQQGSEEERRHYYSVVNSCNGFLCLANHRGEPRVVYNPITSEYVVLPKQKITALVDDGSGSGPKEYTLIKCSFRSGLGHCSDTNRFKVLRSTALLRTAEIHELGTDSWRMLETIVPSALDKQGVNPVLRSAPTMFMDAQGLEPLFLNGFLHWDCRKDGIVSFDFRTETFGEVQLPVSFEEKHKKLMRVGVFGGCLSVCDFRPRRVDFWVMDEYGHPDSWTKKFVIETWALNAAKTPRFQPLECLSSGEMLMLDHGKEDYGKKDYGKGELVCYDFVDRTFRIHKFGDNVKQVRAYLHTPTFASLKDVVAAEHVRVLDVFSRTDQIAGEEALVLMEGRKMCLEDSLTWNFEGKYGVGEEHFESYYR